MLYSILNYLWTIATLYTSYFLPVEEKKRRQEFAAKHGLSDEVKEGISYKLLLEGEREREKERER